MATEISSRPSLPILAVCIPTGFALGYLGVKTYNSISEYFASATKTPETNTGISKDLPHFTSPSFDPAVNETVIEKIIPLLQGLTVTLGFVDESVLSLPTLTQLASTPEMQASFFEKTVAILPSWQVCCIALAIITCAYVVYKVPAPMPAETIEKKEEPVQEIRKLEKEKKDPAVKARILEKEEGKPQLQPTAKARIDYGTRGLKDASSFTSLGPISYVKHSALFCKEVFMNTVRAIGNLIITAYATLFFLTTKGRSYLSHSVKRVFVNLTSIAIATVGTFLPHVGRKLTTYQDIKLI